MAEKLLVLEAVNLFVGDHDPEATNHLTLQSLALPTLDRVTVNHLGGGAPGEVEWSMNALRAIQPTFKLLGYTESTYREFGVGTAQVSKFTGYGVLRNKVNGTTIQAKTVIRGVLGRVAPDQFERAGAFGHDHSITEVTHYELHVGGKEWFYWDYFTTTLRQFEQDSLAESRILLGIE